MLTITVQQYLWVLAAIAATAILALPVAVALVLVWRWYQRRRQQGIDARNANTDWERDA